MKQLLLFIFIIFLFFGCLDKKVETLDGLSDAKVVKISWDQIKGFQKDNLDLALEVFQKDCIASKKNPYLKNVCEQSFNYTSGKEFFTSNFTPYTLQNLDTTDTGLITGYYEPILKGSFTPSDIYKYPIYKTPKDLINIYLSSIHPELKHKTLRGKIVNNKIIPYETRQEIENKNNLEPLLYLDNKIDKFFLEIQGSGKVLLDTGKLINVAYANQNGRKYYAIGRKLIEIGAIKREDISLQTIKQWCLKNPKKIDELFYLNESVVFFKESSKTATGSLGVELISLRNIAVDKKYIPLGFPVFLNTTDPISDKPIEHLVIAADTGGAIKGEIRADLFWGNGFEAELKAGKMAQKGILTIFVPNDYKKENNFEKKFIKAKGF